MKTKLVKISDLEEIFWKDGHYVDKKGSIISVEAVGLPVAFGSSTSVGLALSFDAKGKHKEKKTIADYVNHEKDKTHREIRFYVIGRNKETGYGWQCPISFFRKKEGT